MSPQQMFYKAKAAATEAGVSVDTIKKAIRAGHLRAKQTSRDDAGNPTGDYLISRAALEAWFESLADA